MRGSWRVRCRIKTKLALREQNSSGKRWKPIRACRFWVLWVIVCSRFEILSPAICLCFWNAWVLTCAVQGGNEIGDEGAKIIGEALKVNTSLLGLGLVSYFLFSFWDFVSSINFVFLKCVGADVCGTGVQWYIRCGSKIHRGSAESQYERADSGSCE